jgi:chromosomal replication initiation ATPase DnaA
MGQFALPLEWPGADASGFIVGAANRAAVRLLDHVASWPVPIALLTGPPRSGRSLLARRFQLQQPAARVIDDGRHQDEEQLFHAWNAATTAAPLLIVADAPPPAWQVKLPDLASRLMATPHVAIQPPDDALLAGLIEKLLLDRGRPASRTLVDVIARRVERSYAAVEDTVARLDQAAGGTRLTAPFARSWLDRWDIDDSSLAG